MLRKMAHPAGINFYFNSTRYKQIKGFWYTNRYTLRLESLNKKFVSDPVIKSKQIRKNL